MGFENLGKEEYIFCFVDRVFWKRTWSVESLVILLNEDS